MSTNITFNNVVYPVPTQGDSAPWGPALDRYLVALGAGAFSPAGGSYPLTADLNLGSSFGLVAPYYKSSTANIASAGTLRLAKTDSIAWRNNGGGGNNLLAIDGSDNLTYNGVVINNNLSALPDGAIWIGNVSNVPTPRTLTGDVTVSDTGVTLIPNGTITNAKVNNSAAIAYSKLSLTASIVNADIANAAAIAYSKLNLAGDIANTDLVGGAYSAITGLGSQSQDLNMNSHKVTNLTNGSASSDAAAFGQVKVIQIVSFNTTTATSTTSNVFQSTSLTANITPTSASNKILIWVSGAIENDNSGVNATASIFRGTTNLGGTDGFMFCRSNGITVNIESVSAVFLDSPATTASTTYTVKIRNNDNSSTVLWGVNGTLTQSMILAEVVA